ncbi:hypothetical protein E2P81_ATG05699 [Venturia nashicola]|nr:hypothetical protein E2P81_ATG05699 [Venturia nashicola]
MMQKAVMLVIVAGTLLVNLGVAAAAVPGEAPHHIKIHNNCDFPIWVNDVVPSVDQWDAWSEISPFSWFTAANDPVGLHGGLTQKIGLQRGTNDVLQLEVAETPARHGTYHYDMSSIDGNPFFHVGKRVGCYPNWQEYDFQYCAPYQTEFPCGKQVPGSFKVMHAPNTCGDIVLELCV